MNQRVVGIDVGSSKIKIVALERFQNGDRQGFRILGSGSFPSQGLRRGEILDQKELAISFNNCLKKCQASAGFPIEEAYLGVEGENLKTFRAKGVVAVSRADEEITEYDIERVIEAGKGNLGQLINREVIHSIPISFKIDDNFETQNPVGLKGMRLEADILFVTILGRNLKNLIKSLEANKVAITKIVASPLASSRLLLSKSQKEVGVLLLDIGGNNFSLIVFEQGVPISMEVFPIGSDHITQDIGLGFQISLKEAEEIKISYNNDNITREQKKKLDDIIEARFSDIFELVDRHLKKIGRSGLLPAGIVLTGGGANLPGISEYAKKFLRLPAQVCLPEDQFETNDQNMRLPQWSVAIGLCLTAIDDLQNSKSFGSFSGRPSFLLKWLRSLLP